MNLRSQMLVLGLALSALLSCKKDNNSDPVTPPVDSPAPDVYLTGITVRNDGHGVVCYWKNGVRKKVNDSTSTEQAYPFEIVTSGNDTYMVGYVTRNNLQQVIYWKNGAEAGSFGGSSKKIIVYGNDVYIPGIAPFVNGGSPEGRYWKNGVAVSLNKCIEATNITVNNGDVYVSGICTDNGGPKAAYWKNGVLTILGEYSGSRAHAIFVQGNDVYVSGYNHLYKATYWKNGVPVTFPTTYESRLDAIMVKGTDVYCSGYEDEGGTGKITISYWKNGIKTQVANGISDGAGGDQLIIQGNDVYTTQAGLKTAAYWKNNKATTYSAVGTDSFSAIYLAFK